MKKIQMEDIVKYRFLSDVQYSPGGCAAAFTVSWVIENTGGTNWTDEYKLVFDSGVNFALLYSYSYKRFFNTMMLLPLLGEEMKSMSSWS